MGDSCIKLPRVRVLDAAKSQINAIEASRQKAWDYLIAKEKKRDEAWAAMFRPRSYDQIRRDIKHRYCPNIAHSVSMCRLVQLKRLASSGARSVWVSGQDNTLLFHIKFKPKYIGAE
jgi:hypothetical protein